MKNTNIVFELIKFIKKLGLENKVHQKLLQFGQFYCGV